MRQLAARISLDRRVPRIEIPSVQPIVVPRSVNTGTSLERSWMALFEGALTAQVIFKKVTSLRSCKMLEKLSVNSSNRYSL